MSDIVYLVELSGRLLLFGIGLISGIGVGCVLVDDDCGVVIDSDVVVSMMFVRVSVDVDWEKL